MLCDSKDGLVNWPVFFITWKFGGLIKRFIFVMPVPDQVRNNVSGIQNILEYCVHWISSK